MKLRREGKLTEQQVQALIYHQQAKAHLFDLARGEAQNIDEHTVGEVLDRYEAQIRAPVEEAARDRDELSRSERDELERKVEDLAAWRERREREDALRAARRRLARSSAGIAGAALLVVLFTVLAATGLLHSRGEWATAITLLVFLAAACVSGAFKLGWKAPSPRSSSPAARARCGSTCSMPPRARRHPRSRLSADRAPHSPRTGGEQ